MCRPSRCQPTASCPVQCSSFRPFRTSGGDIEPSRQGSGGRVGFEFIAAHPVEEVIHVHLLAAIHPLAGGVDFGIGLNCCHDRRSSDFDRIRLFDNSLECRTYIPLTLWHEPDCLGMAVDDPFVCEAKFVSNRLRAPPTDKCGIDLLTLFVLADRAQPLVSS